MEQKHFVILIDILVKFLMLTINKNTVRHLVTTRDAIIAMFVKR